jgi:hypothetical protein
MAASPTELQALREVQAELESLQAQLRRLDNASASKVRREIRQIGAEVDDLHRAAVNYSEPLPTPVPTSRMVQFPRQLTPDTRLFQTAPSAEDRSAGCVRYPTSDEMVAYPLPYEVIDQETDPVVVASLFIDCTRGQVQDVRQGNLMFSPVLFPLDGDPLLKII